MNFQIFKENGEIWGTLESKEKGFSYRAQAEHFVALYTGNSYTNDGLYKALEQNKLSIKEVK